MNSHKSVTLCGLGMMGKTLARRLASMDCRLVLWNRNANKADSLAVGGVRIEPDLCAATRDADLIIICVTDGSASHDLVEIIVQSVDVSAKAFLVLSTTTVAQAKALGDQIDKAGGRYLGGSILGYPANVAEGDCTIVAAGNRRVFDEFEALLEELGGRVEFLSANAGANCIFDRAVYAAHYGAVVAFIAGASIAKAANLDLGLYTREATAGQLDFALYSDQIESENYTTDEATLAIEADAYADVPDIMKNLNLDPGLAKETVKLFNRGLQSGHAELSIAALANVFRGRDS